MRPTLLCLAAAAALCGCAPEPREPGPPRLVILHATCTLDKRFLSPYRAGVPYTPQLAAFARDAVVFERHWTEAAQSGTAYASIFSGTHADRHGVYHHPSRMHDEVTLVAEAFAAAGYDTYYWAGHPMAVPALGYAQGVPAWNRFRWSARDGPSLTAGDPDFRRLLDRLASDPSYRAFVQATYFFTHGPYLGPAEMEDFRARHASEAPALTPEQLARSYGIYLENARDLQWNLPETAERLGLDDAGIRELASTLELSYKASVENLDRYLGLTFHALRERGLLDEALVAFTADHGEVLHRDNALFHWTHGMQLAPEDLSVPWILRAPRGALAPGRYAGVTRSIDVFPTLAGLAGVPLPPGAAVEGVDLSEALRGGRPPPELVALSHTTTLIPLLAEESKRWTLFHALFPRTDPELIWVSAAEGDTTTRRRRLADGRWLTQVYDLTADPEQRRDRYDPADAGSRRTEEHLARYKRRLVEGFARRGTRPELSDDERTRLRGLGYIE